MKLLVCGTRKKGYARLVEQELDRIFSERSGHDVVVWLEIIEGCCPDSADQYAELWAEKNKVFVHHFPSTSGNYLKRNIEMVEECDEVVAWWDGFSYGTCQAVATAVRLGKPVRIIDISKGGLNG